MSENVDQKARELANRAIAMIEAHERVCTERAREAKTWRDGASEKLDGIERTINEKLVTLGKAIGNVYNRLWVAACSMIAMLVGALAWLLTHPHHAI